MEYFTSAHNPRVKAWAALKERKYREQSGTYLVEGLRSVHTYLESSAHIVSLLYDPSVEGLEVESVVKQCEQRHIPVFGMTAQIFAQVADTVHPQGVMAVVKIDTQPLHTFFAMGQCQNNCSDVVLIVDGVRDPGNLGTMIRTAAAVGARGVISLKGTVDFFHPKVVRSTMGALATIPVIETVVEELLQAAQEADVHLLGADAHATTSLYGADLRGPMGLVIGGEAQGITHALQAHLATSFSLPMPGVTESLNAGVASSIMLYEALRQRLS